MLCVGEYVRRQEVGEGGDGAVPEERSLCLGVLQSVLQTMCGGTEGLCFVHQEAAGECRGTDRLAEEACAVGDFGGGSFEKGERGVDVVVEMRWKVVDVGSAVSGGEDSGFVPIEIDAILGAVGDDFLDVPGKIFVG